MCRVLLIHTTLTYTNRICLRKKKGGKRREEITGDSSGNGMMMIHVKWKRGKKKFPSGQYVVMWSAEQTRKGRERTEYVQRWRRRVTKWTRDECAEYFSCTGELFTQMLTLQQKFLTHGSLCAQFVSDRPPELQREVLSTR